MNSIFESIESSFKSIDDSKIESIRHLKANEFSRVESDLLDGLSDLNSAQRLNIERSSLLYSLKLKTDRNLATLEPATTRFRSGSGFEEFDLQLEKCLVYSHPMSIRQKLTYLHLLPSPTQYVDFDLFDIKFAHSSIRQSTLLSANRIFLVISSGSTHDYIMQVHRIDRSSLATCRQVRKRSVFKFDFVTVSSRIVGAFNYRYVEIYDFNLAMLKQVDFVHDESGFLSYKRMLSNQREIVFDCNDYYRIYAYDMTACQRVGQVVNRNGPFYIDLYSSEECELMAVSKQFLFYSSANRHFIQLVSRTTGLVTVSFSMTRVFDSSDFTFYTSLSFYVDFLTSVVYFKSELSNHIFSLDFRNPTSDDSSRGVVVDRLQTELDSNGLRLQVLFETHFAEPILTMYKRNFSTRNLKLVNII